LLSGGLLSRIVTATDGSVALLTLGGCLLLRVLLIDDLTRVVDVVVLEALTLKVLRAAFAGLIEVESVRIAVTLLVVAFLFIVLLALLLFFSLSRLVLTDLRSTYKASLLSILLLMYLRARVGWRLLGCILC